MKKVLLICIFGLGILLSACGSSAASSPAVGAVEGYVNAIVANDADKLSALSCADWESDALIELDSLQAVTSTLDGFACQETGTDGEATLVHCDGKMILSYNGENQELDLSTRTYQVVEQSGDWLICGVR
ncbi:hypothetical protein [Candidatus Villigracilis saccharophilus]|uniref:hypothetical protein n=1 Tax=Candidatus Villigracilis saccharophilus TaxID=3140684 RepID=UPI003135A299|nr:hypothetical protein [Anaerolineales bacterium]